MIMEIANTGRTGKDNSITFDTDRKIFCRNREKFDVFIYAERVNDVKNVVNDLKKIGYREVPAEEFRHSEKYLIITPKPDGKPCVIVVMPDAAFIVSRLDSAIEIWTEALTTTEGYMLADLFLNFLKDKEAFREALDKIFTERVNEGGSVAGISSLNELNEALDEISSYAGKYSLDIYNYTCDVGDVVTIPSLLYV